MIWISSTWLDFNTGSMNRFANRNTKMFCTVSLPRKWSMRKIWSSCQYLCSCSLSASALSQILTERLLDDEATPSLGLVREPGFGDRLRRVGEHARWEREVEDRGPVQRRRERAHRLDRDVAAMELDPVDEAIEILLVDVDVGVGHLNVGPQVLVEFVRRPVLPRVPDDLQVLEALSVLEPQQRREQQARREIAGCADHDECGGVAHDARL